MRQLVHDHVYLKLNSIPEGNFICMTTVRPRLIPRPGRPRTVSYYPILQTNGSERHENN